MIAQQKAMLEANQKLMNQLMQNCMKTDQGNSQPQPQPNPTTTGTKKPRWEEWQTKKVGESIQHNGKTWWWCPHHSKGKGLYVRHRPENHQKWLNGKTTGTFFCEQD